MFKVYEHFGTPNQAFVFSSETEARADSAVADLVHNGRSLEEFTIFQTREEEEEEGEGEEEEGPPYYYTIGAFYEYPDRILVCAEPLDPEFLNNFSDPNGRELRELPAEFFNSAEALKKSLG